MFPNEVLVPTNVADISAGNGWFAALKDDGTVWTWGDELITMNELSPVPLFWINNL
jgi:alpha-tubulin suppressor-like RCC1 family protein